MSYRKLVDIAPVTAGTKVHMETGCIGAGSSGAGSSEAISKFCGAANLSTHRQQISSQVTAVLSAERE